jgi:hypothetical protein
MREYRLYFGDENGAFGVVREVWLATDEAALEIARRLLREIPGIDIWQGDRRVALFAPGAAAPQT